MLLLAIERTEPLRALPSITEMWPILIIVVLLFGARKLPELARAMGTSITQFKKGLDNEEEEPKAVDGEDRPAGD
jgi:sec-independent protein translocase protein TatA